MVFEAIIVHYVLQFLLFVVTWNQIIRDKEMNNELIEIVCWLVIQSAGVVE